MEKLLHILSFSNNSDGVHLLYILSDNVFVINANLCFQPVFLFEYGNPICGLIKRKLFPFKGHSWCISVKFYSKILSRLYNMNCQSLLLVKVTFLENEIEVQNIFSALKTKNILGSSFKGSNQGNRVFTDILTFLSQD